MVIKSKISSQLRKWYSYCLEGKSLEIPVTGCREFFFKKGVDVQLIIILQYSSVFTTRCKCLTIRWLFSYTCVCFNFSILTVDDEDICNTEDCEFAAKKRKKDHFRNNANSQCKTRLLFTFMEHLPNLLKYLSITVKPTYTDVTY